MRKLYPMPVDGLFGHPDLLTMPAAGAGMVLRLLLHFWATDCRPLPKADHELKAIARAHTPTWVTWKSSVLKVVADMEPALVAYWNERTTKSKGLRIAAREGQAARKARSVASHIAQTSPAPEMLTLPAREANAVERPVSRAKAKASVEAKALATMTDRQAA